MWGLLTSSCRLAPRPYSGLLVQASDKLRERQLAMQNPTLLDTIETTGSPLKTPLYRDTIRKHCQLEWTATEELYRYFDNVENRDRVFDLKNCRTRAWFVRNRLDGHIRVAANSCRLRWCPLCAKARANFIRFQVSEWFGTADHPKFLTVTVKHSQLELTAQINKIYDSFRKLRKDKFFKKHCTGGLWFFQLCWNPKRHEWHPHIHSIVTGSYMDYKKLRAVWQECTEDSKVLDIRAVRDPKTVGDYVARYSSRPCELSNLPAKQGIEAMMSLYGRRLAGSWGTAKGITFRPQRVPDPENWEYMGNWQTIHELAASDERAQAILKAYYANQELGDGNSCYDVEAFIDDIGMMEPKDLNIDPKPPPILFDS